MDDMFKSSFRDQLMHVTQLALNKFDYQVAQLGIKVHSAFLELIDRRIVGRLGNTRVPNSACYMTVRCIKFYQEQLSIGRGWFFIKS